MAARSEALPAPGDRPPYRRPAVDVVASLGGDARRGLTASEAAARLQRHGRNELPSPAPVPAWLRFLAQFKDVLTILLIVATAVSFIAWWVEGETSVPYEGF